MLLAMTSCFSEFPIHVMLKYVVARTIAAPLPFPKVLGAGKVLRARAINATCDFGDAAPSDMIGAETVLLVEYEL